LLWLASENGYLPLKPYYESTIGVLYFRYLA
jgi:hypothetical protein